MDGYNENVELITNFIEEVSEDDIIYWLSLADFK